MSDGVQGTINFSAEKVADIGSTQELAQKPNKPGGTAHQELGIIGSSRDREVVDFNGTETASTGAVIGPLPIPIIPTKTPQQTKEDMKLGARLKSALKRALQKRLEEEEKITVFRVESSNNQRLFINAFGEVGVVGHTTLFLNFGDEERALKFLEQRLGQGYFDTVIKSFDISKDFADQIRMLAVPESMAKQYPNRPIKVDVTKATDQFGLRSSHIDLLKHAIIQGSGKKSK